MKWCACGRHIFYSVGQFFDDFSNVSDDTVIAALSRSQPVPALVQLRKLGRLLNSSHQ